METKQTHTPGPWVRSGGGGIVTESGLTETLSSGREVERRVACAKGTTIEEVSANARLIAAAPDMLAALRSLSYAARDYATGGMTRAADVKRAVKEARAAIAKAEGRASTPSAA